MPLNDSLIPVDRRGGMSVTDQIMELIVENIERGLLSPGEKLPTERALAERLNVARGTVKAAYKRLQNQGIISTRQGSGSYVLRDMELASRLRDEKACVLIERSIAALIETGFSPEDIGRLFNMCLGRMSGKAVRLAILSDAPELLMDFKRQLSFLQGVSVSVFILDSITENVNPGELLQGYDLIITTDSHYGQVSALLPGSEGRLMPVSFSPGSEASAHLQAIPRDARIGIICRSSSFLSILKEHLISLGFDEGRILSFFEMDYTTKTYFPGGIDVLISFADAHIFTNPAFSFRNEEFWAKGGKIIAFRHQISREAVLRIEERAKTGISADI